MIITSSDKGVALLFNKSLPVAAHRLDRFGLNTYDNS